MRPPARRFQLAREAILEVSALSSALILCVLPVCGPAALGIDQIALRGVQRAVARCSPASPLSQHPTATSKQLFGPCVACVRGLMGVWDRAGPSKSKASPHTAATTPPPALPVHFAVVWAVRGATEDGSHPDWQWSWLAMIVRSDLG